ncbi:MAG: hypothetical protein OEW52_06565 [Thermoleophilia bacterium]|nr:hypothetical protein [Thermoleophilia bacterium]
MSTYEDTLLAARFSALAPEPLAGDWEEILDRAGEARKGRRPLADALHSRRRRQLVVFAAVALVVAIGAASALAIRAYVFHQGIVGLAPVGATPSTPEKGELVLSFMFGHTLGDPGRFQVRVYADGRMIWQRVGDYSRTDEYRDSTGWLEQRLTPEGVELVKREMIATGLVNGDNLHLLGGEGLYFGELDLRDGDRRVHVIWGDISDPHSDDEARAMPTPEQASALVRLDERLEDPASWLPANAWEDPEIKAYVPSTYDVCLEGIKGLGLSRVLASLPPQAENLLRAQENTPWTYTNLAGTHVAWCSQLTNDEARALERVLEAAGLGLRPTKDVFGHVVPTKSVFGRHFGVFDMAYHTDPTEFSLDFNPTLPDQG